MVAGMTPTTGFVSAVLSVGYYVELAGGGHYNTAALRSKVAEIQANIPEGVPVEGFCVAAGIPSIEKTEHRAEVIEKLNRDFSKPWFGWKKGEALLWI